MVGFSDFHYVLKHPWDTLMMSPSVLKHWGLHSARRGIKGTLSWNIGLSLYRAVMESDHDSPNVIEVGAYQGLSTVYLAYASRKKDKRVKSFDWFQGVGHPDPELDVGFTEGSYMSDEDIFDNNLKYKGLRDAVDLTIGDARNTLFPVIQEKGFCVAFLDVNMFDVTHNLLNQLKKVVTGGEIIILHDYNSPGIIKAAREFIDSIDYNSKYCVIDKNKEFPAVRIEILRKSLGY